MGIPITLFVIAGLDKPSAELLARTTNMFHIRNDGDPVPDLQIPLFLDLSQPDLDEENVFITSHSHKDTKKKINYENYLDAHGHPSSKIL